MQTTTLYLVRHAQAQPLPSVADADWALSERGREQAIALAAVLLELGITRAYTSPFRRCHETMQPFARSRGIELQVHDGLRERCLGPRWIGDFRDVWRRSWEDYSFAVEGGESSWTCRARIAVSVSEIAAKNSGATIALASHGNAMGLFLNTLDPTIGIAEASALRTPELLRIVHDGDGLRWDRDFRASEAFDCLATDFRLTPGIVA